MSAATGYDALYALRERFADVVTYMSSAIPAEVVTSVDDPWSDDYEGVPDMHVVLRGPADRITEFFEALAAEEIPLWVTVECQETDAPGVVWERERDAAYSRSRALGRVLVVLLVLVLAVALGMAAASRAYAAGSDGPTPYTVTSAGITFPTPLAAHGHVNVRLTDGRTAGLHLDPNNGHPGRAWIGATFLPWSALGVVDGCVAWVQWSDANEHYGEGGQGPVCLAGPTPTPTPTSTPEPTWTPTPSPTTSPTPAPSPTSTPTPSPSVSPAPEPTPGPSTTPTPSATPAPTSSSSPTPGSTATSTPSASPTTTRAPAATTSPSPTSPAASPSTPDVVERAEVSAATDDEQPAPRAEVLAATGLDGSLVFLVGLLAVLVGVIAWGLSRRGGGTR